MDWLRVLSTVYALTREVWNESYTGSLVSCSKARYRSSPPFVRQRTIQQQSGNIMAVCYRIPSLRKVHACLHHDLGMTDRLSFSLEGIAEKDGKSYNLEHFSKFISSSPKVADLGFPDSAEPSPYPSQEFTLPIDPKSVSIRNATMDDLPASESALCYRTTPAELRTQVVGILNSAILYTDVSFAERYLLSLD